MDRIEPKWLGVAELIDAHDLQIAQHGGGAGLRDRALLESAVARPRNSWAYGEDDLARLASAYAFGIARNHAFVDGNKRTAWLAARAFLDANGVKLTLMAADAIAIMLSLAAGELSEDELADWFRERIVGA